MIRNDVPPRVIEFRKRLKRLGKQRKAKNSLAWIGSPVAWLALFVSVGTASYNIFYYADEIRLSIDQLPMVFFERDSNAFLVTGPKSLAFINSGTREILILKVELNFNQPDENDSGRIPCKVGGIWRGLDLQFNSAVIKPGQINNIPITYTPGSSSIYAPQVRFDELKKRRPSIDAVIDVQGRNKNPEINKMTLDSCMRFVIITPTGAMDQIRLRVANYTLDKSSSSNASAVASWMFDPDIPISLFRSSSFSLGRESSK